VSGAIGTLGDRAAGLEFVGLESLLAETDSERWTARTDSLRNAIVAGNALPTQVHLRTSDFRLLAFTHATAAQGSTDALL